MCKKNHLYTRRMSIQLIYLPRTIRSWVTFSTCEKRIIHLMRCNRIVIHKYYFLFHHVKTFIIPEKWKSNTFYILRSRFSYYNTQLVSVLCNIWPAVNIVILNPNYSFHLNGCITLIFSRWLFNTVVLWKFVPDYSLYHA